MSADEVAAGLARHLVEDVVTRALARGSRRRRRRHHAGDGPART